MCCYSFGLNRTFAKDVMNISDNNKILNLSKPNAIQRAQLSELTGDDQNRKGKQYSCTQYQTLCWT